MSRPANRDLRIIVAATALSSFGDAMALIALTIRIHDTTGSGLAVSALLLADLLPLIGLAPVTGMIVDRFEARHVILWASVPQIVIAAGLAFAQGLPQILGLVFLLGCGFAAAGPALATLIPHVVDEERITEATAYVDVARWIGLTVGPVVAGGLAWGLGTRGALLIDSASFAVLTAGVFALRTRRPPAPSEEEGGWAEARAGIRYLASDRLLRLCVLVLAAVILLVGGANVAEVFFAKDVLHAGDWGYGVVAAAWTLGMAIGALVTGKRAPERSLAVLLLLGMVVVGVSTLLPALLPSLALTIGAWFVGGMANGTGNVALRSLVLHRVPENVRGRVLAAISGLFTAAQIVAMGLGGALVTGLGPRGTLAIAGAGDLLASGVGLWLYARLAAGEDLEVPDAGEISP